MPWSIAILIMFATPFILAFALFLIIYFSELRHEKQIYKEYGDQMSKDLQNLKLIYTEMPISQQPKSSPEPTLDIKKKAN